VHIHGKIVRAVAICIIDAMVFFQGPDQVFVMESTELQHSMIVSENICDIVFELFLKPFRSISMYVCYRPAKGI
jgi:hypothetical protein